MSIAKLSLVTIVGDMKSLDDVILRCLDRGDFHPEKAIQSVEGIHGFQPLSEPNPYSDILSRMTNVGIQAGLDPQYMPETIKDDKFAKMTSDKAQYFEDFCNSFKEQLDFLQDRRNYLKGEIQQGLNVQTHIAHLNAMKVDFDQLFTCKYVKVRLGRLPQDSFEKLSYYDRKMFLFCPFDTENGYVWGAYFTLQDYAPEVDDIFSSLYFERMRIPDFVHGTPEVALEKISCQIKDNETELALVENQLSELAQSHKDELNRYYTRLKFLSDSFEMREYVSVLKRQFLDVFYITGFIPEENSKEFADQLQELDSVTVEVKEHDSDKRIQPPTKLKNGWFSKPFEMFVEMYGLPSYNDVDPTPIVAFTYSLLFGAMFGDLGQGILLIVLGALLWKYKKMNIGRIINRSGILSCIFGTLYGSFFGFEHFLDPLYINVFGLPGKPVEVMSPEMTNVILLSAVGLGVCLICMSILIDIYIGFKRKNVERAVFSANGIAGLIFYGSILFGAGTLAVTGKNLFKAPYVTVFILLPLAIILFKEPLGRLAQGYRGKKAMPSDGMGAYLTEGVFELFEVVLSFFSNTMSFLRVGGFILSHAGLMAVVFTLSDMVSAAASPFVLVIGNLFVIAMEGLIVGIQVLRLEFYEMFSRYFDGNGKPFTPVRIFSTEES